MKERFRCLTCIGMNSPGLSISYSPKHTVVHYNINTFFECRDLHYKRLSYFITDISTLLRQHASVYGNILGVLKRKFICLSGTLL